MIFELIFNILFSPVNLILNLIPTINNLPTWLGDLISFVSKGLSIFPTDVWVITITNIFFWNFGLIGWAIVEWVYKKIPGVN
ncbi:MAG: hypothetical protein RR945_06955 [Erysipelotrichaceae bacterium]